MGFLSASEAVVARALAEVMAPPPPPDITRWCEDNIVFDERSPMPGPFRIDRFPFLAEIHEVLSPEHPAREVTVRGSAQWGKTVSLLNPTIAAWHEYGPLDSLVVHPTHSAATEWVDNKWLPMRRQAPSLLEIFGDGRGGDNKDAKFNQETLARNGSLKITSAGSPDDLAGTTRRLVALDDVSKFEMTQKGDPEALAESRAAGFEDAKILRISTPQIKGACRVTRSYDRSDRRLYNVPCPHCGHFAPLTWENFRRNLDPERLNTAGFSCDDCGGVIEHKHKMEMVGRGRWIATNPGGDHPGFHLWRAYVPQRDWASIAVHYARIMGWTETRVTAETEAALAHQVEAETEQTFWNDVLGLPYAQASKGPDWEKLRDRVELLPESEILARGVVPARGIILTAGVDCQGDRIEMQVVAHGPQMQRWVVDYIVIPHHIGDLEGITALDAYMKVTWRTETGLRLPLDMLAIDGGTYTEDVWQWAKRHPWSRAIIVKGASTQNGPTMVPQKFDRRPDGRAKRSQKRAWMLNVSQLKADFYSWLEKDDPAERGHVAFARGLGDEFFRMVTAEVRVLKRNRVGVMTSSWELVEPTRRNEGLDTMIYAEAAARRKGWTAYTAAQWAMLEAERSAAPQETQADLFDASAQSVAAVDASPEEVAPVAVQPEKHENRRDSARRDVPRDDWLNGRGEGEWL